VVLLPRQYGITIRAVKTVSVKLPAPLAAWLTQQARELRRSKSALVRQALEQQRSQPGKGTCLDLMEDLCRSVRGPRDLSTNPTHLRGFGQ
jgi:predicted DNA-binding protein